jgi:hypothetical protein
MDLKSVLKDLRPELSASSITTYSSILRSIHKKVFGADTALSIKNFENAIEILKYLEDMPSNKRKTILSALVVLTNDSTYRREMMSDIQEYNKTIAKQEKSKTQKENWLETDVLDTKLQQLKRNADLLYKKKNISSDNLQEIQNYIILLLFSGEYIAPRRSKDYTDFRISDIDKAKDNYLEGNHLVFNSYKTAKTYGTQKVKIPIKLKNILRKWFKINPTEYLLFDKNLQPLTSVKLNQRLNKMFDGKKISVNALRHTYLTDKYGDIGSDLEDMGSSINMATTYIKKD